MGKPSYGNNKDNFFQCIIDYMTKDVIMNEIEVLKKLNTNSHFREFHKEFHGKFILNYYLNNVDIYFTNTVGGVVEAWVTMNSTYYMEDRQVQDFINISKKILQQKVNSMDAYNPL